MVPRSMIAAGDFAAIMHLAADAMALVEGLQSPERQFA